MIKQKENIYEIEPQDLKAIFKVRKENSHKGMYGTIGILGGSQEYPGSIKLASMSATRCGCGIAKIIIPENIAHLVAPSLLENTFYLTNYDNDNKMMLTNEEITEILVNLKSIAIGMGWGKSNNYKDILARIIKIYKGTIIIDADGLNTLAKMDLNILKNTNAKIILTPHLKEFSRLTKYEIEEIKKNKETIALEFAKKYNIILLLKDHNTLITDGNLIYITKTGGAGMAKAGSGDVLSGILASILGYNTPNLLTVASASYLSGLAGSIAQKKYTDISMRSSDIIEFIPNAIKYIRNS